MIREIPSSEEFVDSGLSLLNIAWGTAASLLYDLDDASDNGVDAEEYEDAFWQAAKRQLATALSLIQQGTEFLIKGKIVEISPYLLIMGDPRDWPRNCHKVDTNFAEFRTIDASELGRVYNAVATGGFTDDFLIFFEDMRRQRNAIMHTVDRRIQPHVTEVILQILIVYQNLLAGQTWVNARREFLNKEPTTTLHSTDYVEFQVIREFSLVMELLTVAEMKRFFDFNRRQRIYICPRCQSESVDFLPKTAHLSPNSPRSTTIWCFVCENKSKVRRKDCPGEECPGNVISCEYETCATCGGYIG